MIPVLGALVNGILAGVGLAMVVWVALRLMPVRLLNAATRYAIWWAVMAAIVLLPLAYMPFGSGQVVITKPIGFVPPPSLARVQTPASPTPSIGFVPSSSLVPPPARPRLASSPVFPVVSPSGAWVNRLVLFWLGIAALMFARLVGSIVMLERRKSRPADVPGSLVKRIFAFLRSRRRVRVASSSEIPIPMAAGPWRPSILLPSQLLEALSEQELEQIGIHEAGHFARYDDYALLVQRVLETLLVLNPVVWWVSRQIDLEREIACDDLVVAITGDAQPYAACLARVVELSGVVRGMPMAPAAAEGRSHFAKRVAMLLDRTRNHGTRLGASRLALAVVCVAALSWGAVQNRGFVAFATSPARVATALVPQALMLAQAAQSASPTNSTPTAPAAQESLPAPQASIDGGMSQREKEIIAGTFRQMADKTATAQQAADAATHLAEAQAVLHDDVWTIFLREQAQGLTGGMQADTEFENDMKAAVGAMVPAVDSLRQQKWNDAIANEQSALQALLHADASGLRGSMGKLAVASESQEGQIQIDFAKRQLEELARNLEQVSSQIGEATPAELDEATQKAQFAEQLLKRLHDRLREVTMAQTVTKERPFGSWASASVYVPLEVRDPMGRFVTGLDQDVFHVREDGVEQRITEVLGTEEPPDIFLVTDWRYPAGADFARVKAYPTPYQTESGKVLDTVRTMSQLTVTHRIGRKIAIIVAGSSENTANYTEAGVRAVIGGLAMPAFVFVVPEPGVSGQAGILNEIASRSGGRYVPVRSAGDVAAAIDQVLPEAVNLYFVGYAPTNAARDGSYRNVQVTIQAPRGLPPLTVHSASGYVAATQ